MLLATRDIMDKVGTTLRRCQEDANKKQQTKMEPTELYDHGSVSQAYVHVL
eukprot:m.53978 g.53978  ORF g.53978 m.53978 type:complete len:51 (-) comp11379_c0_seq3:1635-1787(-)